MDDIENVNSAWNQNWMFQPFPPPTTPYACPVCNGKGTVSGHFYDPTVFIGSREQCRSCDGKGIVWR